MLLTGDAKISYLLSNECFTVFRNMEMVERAQREMTGTLSEKSHLGYRVIKQLFPKLLSQILMKCQKGAQKVSQLLNTECLHSIISLVKIISRL